MCFGPTHLVDADCLLPFSAFRIHVGALIRLRSMLCIAASRKSVSGRARITCVRPAEKCELWRSSDRMQRATSMYCSHPIGFIPVACDWLQHASFILRPLSHVLSSTSVMRAEGNSRCNSAYDNPKACARVNRHNVALRPSTRPSQVARRKSVIRTVWALSADRNRRSCWRTPAKRKERASPVRQTPVRAVESIDVDICGCNLWRRVSTSASFATLHAEFATAPRARPQTAAQQSRAADRSRHRKAAAARHTQASLSAAPSPYRNPRRS